MASPEDSALTHPAIAAIAATHGVSGAQAALPRYLSPLPRCIHHPYSATPRYLSPHRSSCAGRCNVATRCSQSRAALSLSLRLSLSLTLPLTPTPNQVTAEILSVLVNGSFLARIDLPDLSDTWQDWFTWQDQP